MTSPEPTPQSVTRLEDSTGGRWQVVTETSRYLLDLDGRTVSRLPGTGAGTAPGQTPIAVAPRGGDHTALPLIELIHCRARDQMLLYIQLPGRPHPSTRITTLVRAIYPAGPSPSPPTPD